MAQVKEQLGNLEAFYRVQRARVAEGRKTVRANANLIFAGPPGTGKTAVARLMGPFFRSLGRRPHGHVVEAGRPELIAEYVGQTAPLVEALVRRRSTSGAVCPTTWLSPGRPPPRRPEPVPARRRGEREERPCAAARPVVLPVPEGPAKIRFAFARLLAPLATRHRVERRRTPPRLPSCSLTCAIPTRPPFCRPRRARAAGRACWAGKRVADRAAFRGGRAPRELRFRPRSPIRARQRATSSITSGKPDSAARRSAREMFVHLGAVQNHATATAIWAWSEPGLAAELLRGPSGLLSRRLPLRRCVSASASSRRPPGAREREPAPPKQEVRRAPLPAPSSSPPPSSQLIAIQLCRARPARAAR